MRLLVSACALLDQDNRILLAERPQGKAMSGLWEFPGGKVEAGETPEQALVREMHEELGIIIIPACLAPLSFASYDYADFHVLLLLYICRKWDGPLLGAQLGREGQKLKWVRVWELKNYLMPPANDPLIAHLRDLLG